MNRVTAPRPQLPDGRSTRWNKHREERRLELLRAVRHVVHEEGPEVSMDTIAQQTGTSKTVFYRYFGDRNGLQDAVGEWAMSVIARKLTDAYRAPGTEGTEEDTAESGTGPATTAEPSRERLRAMIRAYAELGARSPAVYAFAARSDVVGPHQLRPGSFYEGVAELLLGAVDLDGLDPAGQRQWAAGAMGFVRGCMDEWLAGRDAAGGGTRGEHEARQLADRIAGWLWRTRNVTEEAHGPEEHR